MRRLQARPPLARRRNDDVDDPDLVRLLVREITRSPHIDDELDEIGQAFASLERIIRRGQGEGTFRPDLDARLAAWMLYGSLEEVLKALEADNEYLQEGGVFTADVIDAWITYKRTNEIDPIRLRPHPHEFELYYDV